MSNTHGIELREWKPAAAPAGTPAHGLCQEARARIHADREGEALQLLRQALRVDPENPQALSLYGYALAKAHGDYREALRLCRLALRLAPRDPELRTNLGRVHRLHGDNAAAHRNFLQAWRHNRRHAGAASELARMGVRRRPIVPFLSRGHWCNQMLGRGRHLVLRHAQLLRELPRHLRALTP